MKFTVSVLVVAATCSASVIGGYIGGALVGPGNPGAVIKGPVDHATVVGADGTTIVAAADSGTVVAPPVPGGVVTSDAVIAPPQPAVLAVPATAGASAFIGGVGTVVDGPSGIIKTGGFIGATPLHLAPYTGFGPIPLALTHPGLALSRGIALGHGVWLR